MKYKYFIEIQIFKLYQFKKKCKTIDCLSSLLSNGLPIHSFPLLHRRKEGIVDPGRGKERIVDPWYRRWLTDIVEITLISLNPPLIQFKNFHFKSQMVSTACNCRRTCHIDMVLLFPNPECLLWFLATFYLTSQTRSMLRQHHFQRLQVNGAVFEPFPEVYTHNPVFHWKEQIFPKVQHVFTSRPQIRYCLTVCWICLMWSQNYLHFF